jgi:hypothetical protein
LQAWLEPRVYLEQVDPTDSGGEEAAATQGPPKDLEVPENALVRLESTPEQSVPRRDVEQLARAIGDMDDEGIKEMVRSSVVFGVEQVLIIKIDALSLQGYCKIPPPLAG